MKFPDVLDCLLTSGDGVWCLYQFPTFVVEDSAVFREMLSKQLDRKVSKVTSFASAEDMLRSADKLGPGILLLDLHLPGEGGLDLLSRSIEEEWPIVTIVLSGSENIDEVIEAFRRGAVDFIRKPYEIADLNTALERAGDALAERLRELRRRELAGRIHLTARESEVIGELAKGHQSKQIAFDLGISVRTVELHRSKIMSKLGASSAGHAVLLARELGLIEPDEHPA